MTSKARSHTASLVDYLVPSACEIPPMQVVHLESASPTTLGGFRGMGEGGTIGAPAAMANALADALSPLGIEINELPVTPERLFRLIEAARAQSKNVKQRQRANMDLGLKGKIALVTGAASGVGREIALRLAAEGANVALNYRSSAEEAEKLVGEIAAKGGKAKAYQADVADFAAVTAMVDAIVKDFGGLNILINNAGLAMRQRFVETKPEDWRRQIDAWLYGAIHCCHAAAPHLEAAKNGRIVSVIGDSSRVGESGLAIVAAARAGVVGLMKSLAREFGRSGTTANTVSLGLVETAARQGLGRRQPRKADQALSGAPPRPAGRRGADGGDAGLAAWRLDHRPGAQHQRRLQHGVRRDRHAAHRSDRSHSGIAAPACHGARRQMRLSRRAVVGDLCRAP